MELLKQITGTAIGAVIALMLVNQVAALAVVFPPFSAISGSPQRWVLPTGEIVITYAGRIAFVKSECGQ